MVEQTQIRYIDSPSIDCLESHGVLIPYDKSIITPAIEQAIDAGAFEAEEALQLKYIVEPGDCVLEIGAGIGFISTILARHSSVDKVVAVEANPRLLPYMQTLHDMNGISKVTRKNVVLTNDEIASMTFYLRKDFWMGSLSAEPNAYVETVDVPTASLDELIRTEQISLIVCDIEGAESFLFNDADLTGVTRVYLELHDHVTGLKGVRDLFQALEHKGFAYDPRYSEKSVVLFRRVEDDEVLRPYAG